ncbi:MAG: FeS-binding protein [Denitrovibrio sp.]|nr:MAG: FeS-binding protein [Denitrovibrio sp.]
MDKKLHLIYFSPTGTTRKVLTSFAEGFSGYKVIHHDLTHSATPPKILIKSGIAVFGMPVYGGRAQVTALRRMRKITGAQTPSVVIGLYGNREFEDAIVEMRDVIKDVGFTPIAGGAFIGEHSYATWEHKIAMGRPDGDDLTIAKEFGESVKTKLESGDLTVPKMEGNKPYKEAVLPKGITPKTDHDKCKLCVNLNYLFTFC